MKLRGKNITMEHQHQLPASYAALLGAILDFSAIFCHSAIALVVGG
jgi:hypothetical protein